MPWFIAPCGGPPSTLVCDLVVQLDEQIDPPKHDVQRETRGIPEVARPRSIPGIGALAARALHAENQEIDRSPNDQALVSYGGLDPATEQVGNDPWHAHPSESRADPTSVGCWPKSLGIHLPEAPSPTTPGTMVPP